MQQDNKTNNDYRQFEEELSKKYLQKDLDTIDENGYVVRGVSLDGISDAYVYTVGLSLKTPYEFYELIVLGLDQPTAHFAINAVAKLILKDKIKITEDYLFEVIPNFKLKVRFIPNEQAKSVCTGIGAINPNVANVKFVQLIWPIAHGLYRGLYPGDKGCPEWLIKDQDIELLNNVP